MKKYFPRILFAACTVLVMILSSAFPVLAFDPTPPPSREGGENGELDGEILPAVTSTTTKIVVYLSINMIQGLGWQVGEDVYLYINDPDTGPGFDYSDIATPGAIGTVNFEIPFDLEPDMYVLMQDGVTVRGHTIFNLRITYVSEVLDQVGGSADPYFPTVHVTARSDDVIQSITADVNTSGYWVADFHAIDDINPRTNFIVAQFDPQYNHTQISWWINPPPEYDDMYHPAQIPSVPWADAVNTISAAYEEDWEPEFSTCGQSAGNASVWYLFHPATAGEVTLDTFGSNYNTMLGVWAGFPGSSGVPILCNDNAGGTLQSKVTLTYTAGVYYYIGVAQKGFPQMGGHLKFHVTSFADVAGNHPLWRYVEGFFKKGITTGCATNPMRYCPDQVVTRAQMAVFMLRAVHADDVVPYVPTDVEPDTFADAPASAWMEPWIEQFYLAGYTTGCAASPLRYCPEKGITRAEMAVFLLRALYGSGYAPADVNPDVFIDVPVPGKEWMEPWIEQFYLQSFTTGCGGTFGDDLRYCPERGAGRAEMATFIDRVFLIPPIP